MALVAAARAWLSVDPATFFRICDRLDGRPSESPDHAATRQEPVVVTLHVLSGRHDAPPPPMLVSKNE